MLAHIYCSILQSIYIYSEEILDVSLICEVQACPFDLLDNSKELFVIRACQYGVVGV